jgi:hypothetical protein
VSDPQPPAWNPENHQTSQYGGPPQPPQYSGPPQPPQYSGPPPQYGAPPPQHPYYGQTHQPGHYQQPPKSKRPWLLIGAIVVVLALIGGTGVFLATRGDDEAAVGGPMLTSDSPSPTASPSEPPTYTPEPTPTPTTLPERRRTLKDVDKGLMVYDDVYVQPAKGWRKAHASKYSVSLLALGRGAAYVIVSPVAYPAVSAAADAARTVVSIDHLVAVKKDPVEVVTPANSNIDNQAQISFSGRIHTKTGASISMVARCTVMTGVESIHNVTVVFCVEGRQDDPNAAFRDLPRMLASIARSI